jgi:serine/threonine-protein kinase
MASVYEGVHAAIGKRVAIKVIDPQVATVPGARARFLREAQLTSRLRHPHIVDIADIGVTDGCLFLVMEHLEGEDLAARIARAGPLPVTDAVDIALPVLAAVAAAHDAGIVHCDLKTSNIFLARLRDGSVHPKVLDFGIAHAMVDDTERPIAGSPGYFAPEQVRDPSTANPATDQYALGLMLYECLTGRLPYDGATFGDIFAQIVTAKYLPAVHYRPDLPPALQHVIARAMSLDPGDRFASVVAVGQALLPLASVAARTAWAKTFGAPGLPPPSETELEPELVAVPRSAAPRVFAGLVLVAASALTFIAFRGAGAGAAPRPAPAVTAAPPQVATPIAESKPAPPAPAPAPKVSGRARPRSLRYGPNRAPLIE